MWTWEHVLLVAVAAQGLVNVLLLLYAVQTWRKKI